MSLLKAEPVEVIGSTVELLAVAHAMEQEAVLRYRQLSECMRSLGNDAVATVFAGLAEEEQSHVAGVENWSERLTGRQPDPAEIRWDIPDVFTEEAAELGVSRLVTPYRALSVAVRNEERAFAFWSYIAAHAPSADVRQQAETMAHEELGHVALLRKARRQAFQVERHYPAEPAPALPDVMAHFAPAAAQAEARLSGLHENASARLRGVRDEDNARLFERFAGEERETAVRLHPEIQLSHPGSSDLESTPVDPIEAGLKGLETVIDWYFRVAENATDQAVLDEAQRLAQSAIGRLALLRERQGAAALGIETPEGV